TPLLLAVSNGYKAVVKLLLDSVSLNPKGFYNRIPLLIATERGHETVVKLLFKDGVDAKSKDKYGETPLWWVVEG
ncbi:uncharacterized protein K441DRAFT_591082, partial [Cenococcum geophilum 1.58]